MTTSVDRPKPPTWYTEEAIREAIRQSKAYGGEFFWIPEEQAAWLARHFQLAFNKGHQIGFGQAQSQEKRETK